MRSLHQLQERGEVATTIKKEGLQERKRFPSSLLLGPETEFTGEFSLGTSCTKGTLG